MCYYLGVVVYYAGIFLAGILIGIGYELWSPGSIETANEYGLGLMAMPLGLLSSYLLYYFLKKSWKKKSELSKVYIDDIGNH